MDNEIVNFDDNPSLSVISQNRQAVADLLSTDVDNITVLQRSRQSCAKHDEVVKYVPLRGLPRIRTHRYHDASGYNNWGVGLFLQQSKTRDDIQYVKLLLEYDNGMRVTKLFVRNEDITKILLYFRRLEPVTRDEEDFLTINETLTEKLLHNTIRFLQKREEMIKFGVVLNKGILLYGPPGNGKSTICNWLSRKCLKLNMSVRKLCNSQIIDYANRNVLHDILNSVDLIIMDDIDPNLLYRKKGTTVANSLLTALQGVEYGGKGSLRIFTTNESVCNIDSAFTRPGRIDHCLYVGNPDKELRNKYVRSWHSDVLNEIGEDGTNRIVRETDGCSFAEIESIKTNLVAEHVINDNLDLDRAMELFYESQEGRKDKGSIADVLSNSHE